MKYSNTALTQLTRWYKQILIKCAIFNAAIFMVGAAIAPAAHALDVTTTIGDLSDWPGLDGVIGTVDMSDYSTTTQIEALLNGYATADDFNTLDGTVSDHATSIGNLQSAMSTAQTDISELNNQLGQKAATSVVTALQTTVSGQGSSISALQTTVGDADSGLVAAVNSLQTTVGSSTSGLVKDVNTLKGDVSTAGSVDYKIAAAKVDTALTGTTTAEALTVGGYSVLTTNSELAGAKLAAGSVDTTQLSSGVNASLVLANSALQSTSDLNGANLTDGSVGLSALAGGVQTSLGKADSALQASALNNTALTGTTTAEALTVGGYNVLTTNSSIGGSQLTAGTVGTTQLSSGVNASLTLANSALQAGDNVSALTNDANYQSATQVSASIAAASIAANKITTGTYEGSGLQTAVVGSVTANAASAAYSAGGSYSDDTIGKAIQANATNIATLTTNTTVADGNYIASTDTVAGALTKLDTRAKTNADNIATNTANIGTNTANIAKVLSGDALNNTLTDAAGNKAIIWNEADGGGIRYEQKDGDNVNTVYSGVHGDSTNGVFANMYAKTSSGSTRLMVKGDGVYYLKTNGNNVGITTTAADEVATIGTAANGVYSASGTYTDNTIGKAIQTNASNISTNASAIASIQKYFTANSEADAASATGLDSVAVGPKSTATAENAVALGGWSDAKGYNAVAVGSNADANVESAIAIGANPVVNGVGGIGIGTFARVLENANNSIAIGNQAKTEAATAMAFGQSANAKGESSISIGTSSKAEAATSVALGHTADAIGQSAIAIGTAAQAQTTAIALGHGSDASGESGIAIGTNAAATTTAMAFGHGSSATAESSTAIGTNASATAVHSVAIGTGSVANAANTVSVGNSTTKRKIVNVADGTAANDAATYGQLSTATTIGTAATSTAGYAADASVKAAVVAIDASLHTAEGNIATNASDIDALETIVGHAASGEDPATGLVASVAANTSAIETLNGGASTAGSVANSIATALANGEDPYQTASNVTAKINAAAGTGLTADAGVLSVNTATAVSDGNEDYVTSDLLYDQGYQNATQVGTLITNNAAGATYSATGEYGDNTIGKAIQTNASGISTNASNIATNTTNIAKVLSGDALSNTLTDASGNKAIIWNEVDGGGIRYEQKNGDNVNTVYSGVHGDSTNGVFANMYAKTTNGSSRLMVKGNGVYYLKSTDSNVGITTTPADEVATIGTAASGVYNHTASGLEAETIQAAIDELNAEKTGVADDNVFTGNNTFANANGIKIANGTDSTAEGYSEVVLAADDQGLAVEGAVTATALNVVNAAEKDVFKVLGNGSIQIWNTDDELDDPEAEYTQRFGVDNNGNITSSGTISAVGIATTANTTALGGEGFTNTISGTKTTIGGTTEVSTLKFAGADASVTSIDTGAEAQTTGGANKMATVATVLASGSNAAYDSTAEYGAGTIGAQVKSTAASVDGILVGGTGAQKAMVDSNKVAMTWNGQNTAETTLASSLGNGVYGAEVSNVTNGSTVTVAVGALDNAIGDRTYASYEGNLIEEGQSVGASILSIANAVDTASTTNTKQDTTLSGLAEKVGGSISATDGTFTAANYISTGTLNNIVNADSVIAAVGKLDQAMGAVSSLNTETKTVVGAVNELLANSTVTDGNYIEADNTVAENLGALDEAVDENADAISDINTRLGTTSLTDIVESGKVTDAIAANAANIATNASNIATNTTNIAKVLSGDALSNTLTDASGNKAIIWNEVDGGGIRYEQKDGDNVNTVYSGVHGDSTNGVFANMYAKTTNGSSRLMVKGNGVYYLKSTDSNVGITTTPADEVATIGTAASGVYNNTASGLEAETIQAAIDEVVSDITVADAGETPYNVISAGANVANNLVELDDAMGSVNDAIGDMSLLKGSSNAMINRDENDHPTTAATTIVAALNNISDTFGTIHGLVTQNVDGTYTYAGSDTPQSWTNLAVGTQVEGHLRSLDTSIGDRNYEGATYLTAGDSVADSLVTLDGQVALRDTQIATLGDAIGGEFNPDTGAFTHDDYAAEPNNIENSDSVVAAIGKLDGAMGDVAELDTDATTLADAINELESTKQDNLVMGNGVEMADDGVTLSVKLASRSGLEFSEANNGLGIKTGDSMTVSSEGFLNIKYGAEFTTDENGLKINSVDGSKIVANSITFDRLASSAVATSITGAENKLATDDAVKDYVDDEIDAAIVNNSGEHTVALKGSAAAAQTVYDTTGTADYVSENAQDAVYDGDVVTGATAGTIKAAISSTVEQVNENTGDIADIVTNITVTDDGSYISAAGTVAENLGALDTAVSNVASVNEKQDATISGLAGTIGGEINATTGVFTPAAYTSSDNFADSATLVAAVSALDSVVGNVDELDTALGSDLTSAANTLQDTKQDNLTAGNGISLSGSTISVKLADNSGLQATESGLSVNTGATLQVTGGALGVKYGSSFTEDANGLKIDTAGVKLGMIDDGAVTFDNLASSAVATSITGSTTQVATDSAVKNYVDGEIDAAIVNNAAEHTVALKGSAAAAQTVYDTTGTANYVEANAENATYTGTQVNVAPGSVAPEATIKSALSAASEQIDINTAAISSIQDNITVANPGATPYNVISEGANVAANLVALDAAAGTAATINTNQNETLNALAGLIDGGSVNANGVRTAGTALSDNFTADNLVGAANELLGNITVEEDGNYIAAGADVAGNLVSLDAQVKANTDAIGSQTTKVESIGEAIGGSFDDDGNFERASYGNPLYNISDDDTIVEAIGNLDSAIGNREISSANAQINTATGSSVAAGLKAAGDVIGLAQSAKATEGLLKNYAITGDSTVEGATSIISALNTIATTAAGLALNNTFTGTNTFGDQEGEQVIISSNGDLTVDGDLTIGEANAIRSSGTGVLDMNHNSLTNVQGLTLVDANNNTATLSLNGTTIETGNKNIDVGTGSLNGQSLNIGSADQFTVDSSGNVSTTGTASFGATTVTSLDAGSGTIKTTGAIEGGTLDISGNAEIGGALDVTGNTTIGGTLDVTGALSGSTATFTGLVTSEGLNAGSGDITTTGNLSAGAATVTSLDAGSGLITTTGTVHGSTIEAGSHTSLTEGRLVVSDGTKTSSLEKDKLTLDGIEMTKNDEGNLNIASGLNVVGDETISGTLTIGEANAITGTEDTLDMGANALTNVNGLTLTDGAAEPSTITMAVQSVSAKQYGDDDFESHTVLGINQDTFVDGLIGSTNGLSVFKSTGAQYEEVFSVDDTGSILSDMLKTDNGEGNSVTLGKDESSKTILNGSMQFGTEEETPYVNAIDDGSEAQTEGGANTMATVATVLKSAENAAYTEVGPNITEATTIKNAIHTLDTKMGAVADVAVNGYETEDASARTLTGAVSALNTNMQNVLGSVYKADGSYDATALVGNGLEAGSTSLTDAVTKYAENVQAAMGTTFAEDGSYTNTFTRKEAVDYDGLESQSLVSAIAQLDSNIGSAITGVEREGVEGASTSATNTVNANIQALDTAIGNLDYTGGELDYANETGSVTDAIKTINANIGAAIAAEDIADRTVGRIASDNTVNQNLVALDTAIGADVTVLYNGVSVENAVNGNIDALNTIIGDVSTLDGNALNNGTDDQPETVVEALQNINDTLGVIHGLVESEDAVKTTTDVDYYGNLAFGDATVESHLEALDASIGDRRGLESLNEAINEGAKESIAVALEAAGNAIGDADFSQTHYASSVRDASSAIRVIDSNLYRLDNEVKDLRKNMKRGFASMAAMSAMVPNARAKGNTQLSFGSGMYSGHTGFALGGFHWFTDNLLMNVGVAYGDGDSSDVVYRAGVTYSW